MESKYVEMSTVNSFRKYAGLAGLTAVSVFILALLFFGTINPVFDFLQDFISELGAKGAPNALGWNLVGFVLVGLLLFVFGLLYGLSLKDQLLAWLLSLFGLGFAATAIPIDMEATDTAVSKAHIVIICLGLAFWCFGLARLSAHPQVKKTIKIRANISAILLVLSMIGFVLGFWSMPITHRLVFGIVFTWTLVTALDLLTRSKGEKPTLDEA